MQLVSACCVLSACLLGSTLVASSPIEGHRQFRVDYEYHPKAHGWFKFHQVPATWDDARAKCFHEGAVLASPINKQVYEVMKKTFENEDHKAFTGIQSLTPTGDYFSIEGVHLVQMPVKWSKGEPNNRDNEERCLAMKRDGTVADVRCTDGRAYLCYKNKTRELNINDCGTSDEAYVEVTAGHCYKFHPECLVWDRAHMVCSSEGGHLLVLNSDTEARLVQELYSSKIPSTVKCDEDKFVAVGIRSPSKESAYWSTVDGQTLEEAGFAHWAADQPDDYGGEYCGSVLFLNSTVTDAAEESALDFNDVSCTRELPFICEINGPRLPYVDEDDQF